MRSIEHTEHPSIGPMLRMTFEKWYSDDIPRHAAVLAFYALFTVAPILLLCLEVLGFIYGREVAESTVQRQVTSFVNSPETGDWVQSLLSNVLPSSANWWVTVAFVLALIFGASSFFGELKRVLNQIWGVPLKPDGGWGQLIFRRLQAVVMVLASSLLIFLGLLATSWLSSITDLATTVLNIGTGYAIWSYILLIFILLTFIFALIYKYVPDVDIEWNDVWIGAAATALLISITRLLISLYFSYSHTTTMFGAASALVVILLSVYYAAQIFFLGAEFTYIYCREYGAGLGAATGRVWRLGAWHSVDEVIPEGDAIPVNHSWEPRESGPIEFNVENIEPVQPLGMKAESKKRGPLANLTSWVNHTGWANRTDWVNRTDSGTKVERVNISSIANPLQNWWSRRQKAPESLASDPLDGDQTSSSSSAAAAVNDSSGDGLSERSPKDDDLGTEPIVQPSVISDSGKKEMPSPLEPPPGSAGRSERTGRTVRPLRDVIVAAGVIGAVSLTALAGVPFWRRRKDKQLSANEEIQQ